MDVSVVIKPWEIFNLQSNKLFIVMFPRNVSLPSPHMSVPRPAVLRANSTYRVVVGCLESV